MISVFRDQRCTWLGDICTFKWMQKLYQMQLKLSQGSLQQVDGLYLSDLQETTLAKGLQVIPGILVGRL